MNWVLIAAAAEAISGLVLIIPPGTIHLAAAGH
jgi:hypothetical protein